MTNTTTSLPGQIASRTPLRRLAERLRARRRARADRAGYRRMLRLDDHMLKDIGLTRADVHWALHQPDAHEPHALAPGGRAERRAWWPRAPRARLAPRPWMPVLRAGASHLRGPLAPLALCWHSPRHACPVTCHMPLLCRPASSPAQSLQSSTAWVLGVRRIMPACMD